MTLTDIAAAIAADATRTHADTNALSRSAAVLTKREMAELVMKAAGFMGVSLTDEKWDEDEVDELVKIALIKLSVAA